MFGICFCILKSVLVKGSVLLSSTRGCGCCPSQKPGNREARSVIYATAAVPIFDHIFFALPRGVPVSNCFNGHLRALSKNSLEDRKSKFHLVTLKIAYIGLKISELLGSYRGHLYMTGNGNFVRLAFLSEFVDMNEPVF